MSWENLFLPYANNKDADQPAHPRSLISVFVVRCLASIISLASIFAISWLAFFCSWAGQFESYLVENPEDRFSRDKADMYVVGLYGLLSESTSKLTTYKTAAELTYNKDLEWTNSPVLGCIKSHVCHKVFSKCKQITCKKTEHYNPPINVYPQKGVVGIPWGQSLPPGIWQTTLAQGHDLRCLS